jgi:hypothetical protein
MVTVNDLSATDVKTVNTDLAAGVGGGDQLTDHVTVNGTNANDAIEIAAGATWSVSPAWRRR